MAEEDLGSAAIRVDTLLRQAEALLTLGRCADAAEVAGHIARARSTDHRARRAALADRLDDVAAHVPGCPHLSGIARRLRGGSTPAGQD